MDFGTLVAQESYSDRYAPTRGEVSISGTPGAQYNITHASSGVLCAVDGSGNCKTDGSFNPIDLTDIKLEDQSGNTITSPVIMPASGNMTIFVNGKIDSSDALNEGAYRCFVDITMESVSGL